MAARLAFSQGHRFHSNMICLMVLSTLLVYINIAIAILTILLGSFYVMVINAPVPGILEDFIMTAKHVLRTSP